MAATRRRNTDVWMPFSGFKSGGSLYDPLDLASGSIDPLGFSRGYLALADSILPGFTTVTSTPRYVSMLCAALSVAQERFPASGESPAELRKKRLGVVKNFEKAWALACGLAEADIGKEAIAGLRGIRYVKRRLQSMNGALAVKLNSFNLLANQMRYGAVGTYGVFLESMHLAVMDGMTLRPLGEELANAMPKADGALHDSIANENEKLPLEDLKEWGLNCHPGRYTDKEGQPLRKALSGGGEATHADHVRDLMLRLLAGSDESELEPDCLARCRHWLERSSFDGTPEAKRSIATGLRLIEPFEKFYQACLFILEFTQAAATANPSLTVRDVLNEPHFRDGAAAARTTARNLTRELTETCDADPVYANGIRKVLNESGIEQLMKFIAESTTDSQPLEFVLWRHLDVQEGKFDGGQRKGPWIALNDRKGTIALTAQRHQLAKAPDSWEAVVRHPYRTWSAMQFVKQCKIKA